MDHMAFGELLQAFRQRRCLTQQQLATRLGVHRNSIGGWERGDYRPENGGMVLELARHLHLDDQETRQLLEASLTALAPYWSVPALRNPFFTGREGVLEILQSQLCADQALTRSYALHGLGGIGKTQLAVEYAYRHALEYTAVFWIAAESVETMMLSSLAIADVLKLPERHEADQQQIVAAVQRWLSTHQRWLLIWDNVEDLDLLQRWLPPARQGTHLITTRSAALGTLAQSLELSPLEQEEGILLLLRRAKVLDMALQKEQVDRVAVNVPEKYAAGRELVKIMGGLPLALDQAGAYIEETGCSFDDYLQMYQEHQQVLLARRGRQATNYPDSVATTWSLSLQQIEQANPAAAELLHLCAFLAPDSIPEELLKGGAAQWTPLLQQAVADCFAFNQMLEDLLRFSLIKRRVEDHLLSIHRLVQVVLRETMELEEQHQWAERVVRGVHAVFPADPKRDVASWPQCLRYLEQAQTCDTLIQQYLLLLPEAADVLDRTGVYLNEHAFSTLAEPLYQRAIQIREQQFGPGDPQVAASLNNLAELYYEQKKYTKAEPLLQRALQLREEQFGPEHIEVAASLNNLASLKRDQGEYAQAEALFQRALRIKEQLLGPEHIKVASSLNNLAILYLGQGRYAEAEGLLQRALTLAECHMGLKHPQVVFPLLNLGTLSGKQGKYAEAEAFFQRAYSIVEVQFGPRHPQVSFVLTKLANLFQEQGNYGQAESLYQRALSIQEKALPCHPDTAELLHAFATLRIAQDDPLAAAALYRRTLAIREQALGATHPQTADTRERLAQALLAQEVERNAEVSGELRSVLPVCPCCQGNSAVVKSGTNRSGSQRFRCHLCRRYFTPQSAPQGYDRAWKEQALLLAGQGKSSRFIARQLGVNHRTICAWVKAETGI